MKLSAIRDAYIDDDAIRVFIDKLSNQAKEITI